jgi:hypothetical protein
VNNCTTSNRARRAQVQITLFSVLLITVEHELCGFREFLLRFSKFQAESGESVARDFLD